MAKKNLKKKSNKKTEKKSLAKIAPKKKPAKIAVKNKKLKKVNKASNIKTKKVVKKIKKIPLKNKIKQKTAKQKPVKQKIVKQKIAQKKPQKIQEQKKSAQISTTPSKAASSVEFTIGKHIIYPSHGIGKIIDIQTVNVMNHKLKTYLIHFEQEKLTIRVPVQNAENIGLRNLTSKEKMEEIFTILRSGVKKTKGMWSRRAQEYEAKINSGNIVFLAEVLRDLTRDIEDSDRSYSERIIYETAVARLAAEYAVIHKTDFEEAKNLVIVTTKDKLMQEGKSEKPSAKDDFGDEKDESIEEEEESDEEEEEEELDDYEDEDDDEKPKKRR